MNALIFQSFIEAFENLDLTEIQSDLNLEIDTCYDTTLITFININHLN